MVGIGTIQIKMFDGVVRDLIDPRYVPQMKKNILSWSYGVKKAQGDYEEWYSQDRKGVHGCDEGCQR